MDITVIKAKLARVAFTEKERYFVDQAIDKAAYYTTLFTPKQLNDACIEAMYQCTRARDFATDSEELLHPYSIEDLPKHGMEAVVKYWASDTSCGGSFLWKSGYASELDDDEREFLEMYRV